MAYYVRGPDGKRVLKTTKKDIPKLAAQLAEVEARAKPTKAKQASKVADRRKFNGGRRKKKPKLPPEAPKYDLLTLTADKLTPELQQQFLQWVHRGLPQESACAMVGILPQTLRIWQAKAMDPQEPDPKYGAFIMAVQKAEALLESRIEAHAIALGGAYGKNGELSFESQADARAMLQMRFRRRWGNGAAVTVDKESGELTVGFSKPTLSETAEMTVDEYESFIRLLERSLERVKDRGGIRKDAKGVSEVTIGHRMIKNPDI